MKCFYKVNLNVNNIGVVGHFVKVMILFKTYEFELKTKRTKDSVIKDLSKRATFDNDEFRIKSEIFSLRRGSYVTGKVLDNGQTTTVSVKIYASADYKALAIMWFGFLSIFLIAFLIQQLSMGQFSPWILAFPLVGLLGYFMIRLFYWFSVEMQRYFIIGLIS